MIARGDPPNRTLEVGATDLPKLDRPVSEQTRRLYIENPRGLPQTLIPDDPPTFVFQSYAHDDAHYVFDSCTPKRGPASEKSPLTERTGSE
jgi:hypothetical protein